MVPAVYLALQQHPAARSIALMSLGRKRGAVRWPEPWKAIATFAAGTLPRGLVIRVLCTPEVRQQATGRRITCIASSTKRGPATSCVTLLRDATRVRQMTEEE